MSVQATFTATERAFHVEGHERIAYDLLYVEGAFAPENPEIADSYRGFGRCLAVIDENVHRLHAERIDAYFRHHGIALTVFPVAIREVDKTMRTLESIIDAFADFGLSRDEPALVVGGGLTTDVAGLACATFRRGTPYVRVPTTLIGLVDASVAIKVAVNHGSLKNRLGAFHASAKVILDFSFLETLPIDQIRNGMAELVKIAVVADAGILDRLDRFGEDLLRTRFGHAADDDDGADELRAAGHAITYDAIRRMLDLEVPNLRELDLDRAIAYGHTWSPTLELAPEVPMLHGHAVSVDMALSMTLAERRGYVSAEDRDRVLGLMSRLGLAVDSPYMTAELLAKGTESIIQTRAGLLRAAVPKPLGEVFYVNDLEPGELDAVLEAHHALCAELPRGGDGEEMWTSAEHAHEPVA